jgi:hypothetical protein
MKTRRDLHQLVDQLSDDEIDSAAELLAAYRSGDRALISLLTAPEAPAEPEELAALDELTEDDVTNVSLEQDVRSRLGIR